MDAFQRTELDCTQCHIAPATRGVPGVLLRSIFPSATGTQVLKSTSFVTDQESLLKDRWGGWYVTGTSGRQQHMGNVTVQDRDHPELLDRTAGTNTTDLTGHFDNSIYLTADSDIVAHLVLAHQTQMHNLITETNYKTRIALYDAQQQDKTGASSFSPGTLSAETRIMRAYADEVVTPDMVRMCRPEPHARAIVEPQSPAWLLLLWNLQPFTTPDPLDSVLAHLPASMLQQRCDPAIAVTSVLLG